MDTDKKTSEPIIETETETKKDNCVSEDINELQGVIIHQ